MRSQRNTTNKTHKVQLVIVDRTSGSTYDARTSLSLVTLLNDLIQKVAEHKAHSSWPRDNPCCYQFPVAPSAKFGLCSFSIASVLPSACIVCFSVRLQRGRARHRRT